MALKFLVQRLFLIFSKLDIVFYVDLVIRTGIFCGPHDQVSKGLVVRTQASPYNKTPVYVNLGTISNHLALFLYS